MSRYDATKYPPQRSLPALVNRVCGVMVAAVTTRFRGGGGRRGVTVDLR